jgi:hypothetical protein
MRSPFQKSALCEVFSALARQTPILGIAVDSPYALRQTRGGQFGQVIAGHLAAQAQCLNYVLKNHSAAALEIHEHPMLNVITLCLAIVFGACVVFQLFNFPIRFAKRRFETLYLRFKAHYLRAKLLLFRI